MSFTLLFQKLISPVGFVASWSTLLLGINLVFDHDFATKSVYIVWGFSLNRLFTVLHYKCWKCQLLERLVCPSVVLWLQC